MYERYFGLSGKPFQLNPDPDFYFGSRGHKRAMAYLEYGLHQGEGFIVVTGEVGAGKTTLLRSLLRQMPRDTIVPVQIVSTQVDSDDLLRLVATAFGISAEGTDKATLLTRLQRHFEHLHVQGQRALLIVDEAQNLSPRAVEELRMLSNFQEGTHSLVQSFLVGQPEFRGIMQRPEMRQLKQRVIASYHLGPLDPEETRAYVEHRLRRVGWTEDPAFEMAAFERMHDASGGVPRKINGICDRLLLAAFLAEQHVITSDDVSSVILEMEEELGTVGDTDRRLAEVHPLPSSRQLASLNPSNVSTQLSHQQFAGDRTILDRLARLDERVSMLEASNAMLFNLMKKVLRILRSGASNESTGS